VSLISLPASFSHLDAVAFGSRDVPFVMAVRSVLQNRSSRKGGMVETIEWGRPRPSFDPEMEIKMGRIRFRLPRLSQGQTPEVAPNQRHQCLRMLPPIR